MLHDVQAVDGLLYMGYWRDGLIILDIGKGIKGGSPGNPQFVSQLRFNYSELYGSGWLAGAHSVFRYKNYVFLGDEVFPAEFDLTDRARIPTKGIVHVIDLSDIDDSSSGSHSKFAGSPEVVQLIGAGLNSAGRFGETSSPALAEILAGVPIRILGD